MTETTLTPEPTPSEPNPGQSTPPTNSQTWQEQARAAGWQTPEENSGFQQSTPTTAPSQTTPVDIGAGSTPMSTPLTPENKQGYAGKDVNKDTGLPDEMSLGEVFSNIKLAPQAISALLADLAFRHHGGANQELSNKLNEHAVSVANPETYKSDSNR